MKKKYTVIISFYLLISYGQTGVNNKLPLGIFHIDGRGDNSSNTTPNKQQQANDIIITVEGNIGIGTTVPMNKLVIDNGNNTDSGLTLPYNAVEGRILTSDTQGNAEWSSKSNIRVILGQQNRDTHPYGVSLPFEANLYNYTGWSITLPPGRWEVTVNMAIFFAIAPAIPSGVSVWLSSTFKDDTDINLTSSHDVEHPALISATLTGPKLANTTKYTINSGSVIINNKSTTPKKYYYGARIGAFYNTSLDKFQINYGLPWGFNVISAVALD